jgi:hypothetical protein
MLTLPVYCYATGRMSGRTTEAAAYTDTAARYICGNRARPDHTAACRFRNENRSLFKEAFTKVPVMAQATGCMKKAGNISADGTKTHADAGKRKAASAGDRKNRAGNMAFIMAKEMKKIAGCQVRVLNSHRLAVIYATDKKTDKEDALKLAHPVTDRPDSRLPEVAIPGDGEMETRKPVPSYRREQKARTQGINRLHGTFVHAGITTVVKKDLKTSGAAGGGPCAEMP